MGFDTLSLTMGSLSEVKVENFDGLLVEAETALTNYRLSDQNRRIIVQTLERIKETPDYGVSPDMVNEIDATIQNVALYAVKDNGDVKPVIIEGSENFSFSLTPQMWKQNRIEGCEALLGDLSKSIMRWSRQLKEKTQDLWMKFKYNIDGLSEDVKHIDGRLAEIEGETPTISSVTIPKKLVKALTGAKNESIDSARADDRIKNDVLYILTVIKVWKLESTEFKNRIIRYFGNTGKHNLSFLSRKHPGFFSKKMFHDENNMDIVYWSPPLRFIGNGGVTFSEHTGKIENVSELGYITTSSGYGIIQSEETGVFSVPYHDTVMPTLSATKLDKLYQVLVKVVDILDMLNGRENNFTLSDRDVKDILMTLNESEDNTGLAESFSEIAVHYQENTFTLQTGFFKYLHNLAFYLINFISLHIEAYNGA